MARGYNDSIWTDYVCRCCGNINQVFEKNGDLKPKYSTSNVYCPVCNDVTEAIKLGDSSFVRSELSFSSAMNGIEQEVSDLLNKVYRKTR